MKFRQKYRYKIICYTIFILIYILIFSTPAAAYELVRAEFPAKPTIAQAGVFDDGELPFNCASGGLVEFDYADDEDTGCNTDAASDQVNSDLSGGGRWHFNTHSQGNSQRTITVDFSMPQDAANCDLLNSYLTNELGLNCGCASACSFQVWIHADRLYKKSATRQSLGRFDVVGAAGPGPDLRIDYVNPLYICEDGDKGNDWRLLQSESCDSTVDVSLAEVSIPPVGSESEIVIGRWSLPFFVRAQRVAPPADGGGTDPGGCTTDEDGDGYCAEVDDCDDSDPHVYPGHADKGKWGRDGKDNDCNGVIDG
jgi:hypothetical protein